MKRDKYNEEDIFIEYEFNQWGEDKHEFSEDIFSPNMIYLDMF